MRIGEGGGGFCWGLGRDGFGIGESCGSCEGGFCSSKGITFGLLNLLIKLTVEFCFGL